jgi:hypothetical protein
MGSTSIGGHEIKNNDASMHAVRMPFEITIHYPLSPSSRQHRMQLPFIITFACLRRLLGSRGQVSHAMDDLSMPNPTRRRQSLRSYSSSLLAFFLSFQLTTVLSATLAG